MDEKTAKNILDCIARLCGYSYSMFDYLLNLCFVDGKEDDMFDNDYTHIFVGEYKEILHGYGGSYRDALCKLLKHLNAGDIVEYNELDKHACGSWNIGGSLGRYKILSKADLYETIKFEAALEGIDLDKCCLEV